jgi:predicted nuclease with TOPRIM domain
MAVEQKIPSPQEVKNGPTQFTNEEITELRELQSKINQVTLQFGQLYITKNRLGEQENLLKNQLSELQKQEETLAQKLSTKYGEGSLDIETGTFTPSS